jgi:hypothetical protein
MTDFKLPVAPRVVSDREEKIVYESLQEFQALATYRNVFAGQYEEVAELIDPNSRNTFFYGSANFPGQKKTDRQVDATGMMANNRFGAICDSLLTPRNMTWHGLEFDEYIMKDRNVRLWCEQATRRLFKLRYAPLAGFTANNTISYRNLGAYGTMGLFMDELDNTMFPYTQGIRYKAMGVGEMFIRQNHQGIVDGLIRWFKLTARQAYQKWGTKIPQILWAPLEANSEGLFDFIHRICPRDDYDAGRIDEKGKPYASYYVSIPGRTLLSEGGYRRFPAAISRYEQAPNEVMGRSPAMNVLPALKTLNAQKRTFLKVGHRQADPVLLTQDDGMVGMSLRPGAMNPGGMSADGKMLVGVLPTGNIQTTEKMMEMEQALINDAFFVTLFQMALNLKDIPQMTATQVIEIMNQKGILLAPTVGNQMSGYLGPMIERELDIAAEIGAFRDIPMPGRLREARGMPQATYSSPISKAMEAQEASGFIRTAEVAKEIVAITGDHRYLDAFDFDTAMPEIARINSVPESWMSAPDAIAAKRKERAAQQQQQMAIQAAPAKAALAKAAAVQAKAGILPPGQSPASGGPPLAQQLAGG